MHITDKVYTSFKCKILILYIVDIMYWQFVSYFKEMQEKNIYQKFAR
jgi:hypothetical protein